MMLSSPLEKNQTGSPRLPPNPLPGRPGRTLSAAGTAWASFHTAQRPRILIQRAEKTRAPIPSRNRAGWLGFARFPTSNPPFPARIDPEWGDE